MLQTVYIYIQLVSGMMMKFKLRLINFNKHVPNLFIQKNSIGDGVKENRKGESLSEINQIMMLIKQMHYACTEGKKFLNSNYMSASRARHAVLSDLLVGAIHQHKRIFKVFNHFLN